MTATKAFITDLERMYSKMLELSYRENLFDDDDDGFRRFVLFNGFEEDKKQKLLKLA